MGGCHHLSLWSNLISKTYKINWLISPFKLPWNKTKKREKSCIVNYMVFVLGWHERWRWRIKAFNRHLIAGRRLVSPTETRTLLAITDLLTIALYGHGSLLYIRLLWKIWLGESIQCNICCRYCIYHVNFNVCLVTKPLGVFSSETKWLNASLLFRRMNFVKNI